MNLEELCLLCGETPGVRHVGPQNAVWSLGPADDDRHPARDTMLVQEWHSGETLLGSEILNQHRLVWQERIARL